MCFLEHFRAAFVLVKMSDDTIGSNIVENFEKASNPRGSTRHSIDLYRLIHLGICVWFIVMGLDAKTKKLKFSINLSSRLLSRKKIHALHSRDVVNAMNFWWQQSSLPSFNELYWFHSTHFHKKSYFSARIRIAYNSAFSDWKQAHPVNGGDPMIEWQRERSE